MATPWDWTPESVAYSRKFGGGLMQQGTDTSPVGHWTQGLARALQGGIGGYMVGQATEGEREGKAGVAGIYKRGLESGTPQNMLAAQLMGNPFGAEKGQQVADQYMANKAQWGQQERMQGRQFSHAEKMQGGAQSHAEAMARLNNQFQTEMPLAQANTRARVAGTYLPPEATADERTQYIVGGQYSQKPTTFDLAEGHVRYQQVRQPDGSVKAVPVAGTASNKPDDAFLRKVAENQAEHLNDAVKLVPTQQAAIGKAKIMRDASERMGQPGVGATLARTFGPQLRAVGLAPERMADIEIWTALVNQLVPAQRPPGSGTMSDRDVQLFKDSLPTLAQTKEGRAFIIDQMEAIARYDIERGRIANEAIAGRIDRKAAYDALMKLPDPMEAFKQFQARQQGGQPPGQNQGGQPRRHINKETGEIIEWNGSQWIPVGRAQSAPPAPYSGPSVIPEAPR